MRARTTLTIGVSLLFAVTAVLYVFGVYLPGFVSSHRPISAHCDRTDEAPLPRAGKLSVVIVDGLGFDFAKTVPEMDWLRVGGTTRPLWVPYPTYTTPALLNFVTGLGPTDSGVRLNAELTEVTRGLDSLTAVARDADRPIDYFGGGWEPFAGIVFAGEDLMRGRIATAVAPFLRTGALTISYFGDVDEQGHKHGEASGEYRAAARRANGVLLRHLSTLDLRRDVMMVVSDHGHRPDGGHGGVEPSLRRAFFGLIGRDVRRGVELDLRPLDDVTSTIAVLAGLKTPACNLGRPMLDAMDWDGGYRARALASAFAQASTLWSKRTAAPATHLVRRLRRGDAAAVPEATKYIDEQRQRHADERAAAATSARLTRLAVFGLAFGVFVLAFPWRRRAPGALRPAAALSPLLLYASYCLVLWLRGYRVTFSKMPEQEAFLMDASLGAAVGLVVVIGALLVAKQMRDADVALLVGGVAPWLAIALYVGADLDVVPPPHAGLLVFLLAPVVLAGAVAASIVAVVNLVAQSRDSQPLDRGAEVNVDRSG